MATDAPAGAKAVAAAGQRLRSVRAAHGRLELWSKDPVAFVHDAIEWKSDEGPASYQDAIFGEIIDHPRLAIRGPHGIGKTAEAALLVLWFATTRDGLDQEWKIPTTASVWRQLTRFLWPEIHKWSRRLRWHELGRAPFDSRTELQRLNLRLNVGEAFAAASDVPDLIEGAHAENMLYIYDEAKGISDATFDATEGAFSGAGGDTTAEAYAFAISTPGEPVGRFYDIASRKAGYEDWHARHVTLEEAIAAGRISSEWAGQRRKQWGVESAVYQNRVLGEFASSDEEGVIPLGWVELANERWRSWRDEVRSLEGSPAERTAAALELAGACVSVGVDVARSGNDKTVLAPRFGNTITMLQYYAKQDTMTTTGYVVVILKAHGGKAVVDVIGLGAGVVDRLTEQGFEPVSFNAGTSTSWRDSSGELEFRNLKSAAWWNMREMLDPENGFDVALPDDDILTGDLTAPHWRMGSGGKVEVESKEQVQKRIGRSTDAGDAVVQAFAPGLRRELQWT